MNFQYVPQQFGAQTQGFPPGPPDSLPMNSNTGQQQIGGFMPPQMPAGYKGPVGPPPTQNNLNAIPPAHIQQGPTPQAPSQLGAPPRPLGPAQTMPQHTFNSPPGHMRPTGQILHPPGPTINQTSPQMHNGASQVQSGQFPGQISQMALPQGQMPPTSSVSVNAMPGAAPGPMGVPSSPPQGQMGAAQSHMGMLSGPPQGQMGAATVAAQGQMGPSPQRQMPTPGQMGSTQGPVGVPPGQMGQMPPLQGQLGPPPTSMQAKSPPLMPGNNPNPLAGSQMQNPPNMPQYAQHKPGGPSPYHGMPPPPGQSTSNQPYNRNQIAPGHPPPSSTNHLANQLNDMHVGGRQYPGGPMKPALNGDNSPHMPPPLTQNPGQYLNGSQGRAPQVPMGYPQMPGQQAPVPGGPYPPQPTYQQQPQQARRLDPDQMPSPIQVTLDDQRTRSGLFCTNQKGLVPPLVSTNFITQDQGNAGPRYIRSTMYNVPTTSDIMKQTAVPFGLVISPLARTFEQEYAPPIVDFGELGPVRCIRCKAYMSPFMQFIDSGRRFQCLFCKATTEVPAEYFQHLDHTGQRVDRYERPELILGTYEFVATKDYCRNNIFPKPPAIIFVIDVSYNNIKSGLVHLLCAEMKEIIKHLPIDQGREKSNMKVGFITFNNTVHFYNIKGNLAQPQMMVVGDTQEMFMPLLDGFLCDIEESAGVIDSLMVQIPTMFAETRETETVLLPAIQAGLEALKASECAGKLLVFHSTLPTSEAPGRLKNRDERKLLGTDKERTVLTPQIQAYNQLGQDCVGAGCSVDLFICNNSYVDVATIGQVCRLTGGEIFKYTYFQADVDGMRLVNDVITDISRPVVFDSIMRVRTSTGVRPTEFFGHFYMSNTTDMEIAAMDCDKAVAIEIKHDDKLTEEEGVYIQVALLFTSCSGQRRLRILNLSLKTCSQMADLYRSCELDTIVNFFSKQCVYRLLENNPKAVKDALVNRCAQILACYRKNCASPSSAGQLILPECMKLLPLYVNCLMKSDAISGGSDMTLDDRSFVMQCVNIMDIPTSVVYFYPRLIPLHEIQSDTESPEIPSAIRCTVEKMTDSGVYLLENGIHMLLWIGLNANQDWIQSVFGVPNAAQVDVERFTLPELDNNLSVTVRNLIDQVRTQRHRFMRLTLVRQRDKLEAVFRHFLMEDRGQDGSSSYVDFLCHMHKEIRQLLS
ncbi:Secretory 24CD [Carabus blaptoides fortunei]